MKNFRLVAIIAATLMLIFPGIMFPQSFAQNATNQTTSTQDITPNTLSNLAATDIGGPSCNAGGTATTGYFLKLDGIPGESGDQNHKCEIDIMSFSWGASHSGATGASGGGGGAGKVAVHDISITMKMNAASPPIITALETGKHIKTAVITIRKAGGEVPRDFLKITLTDVLIGLYQTDGNTGGSDQVPTDQFSLNFAQISVEYRPTAHDGSLGAPITSCFNFHTNHKC